MTVYNLIREQIETKHNKIAVVFGNKQITYAQLDLEINKLAKYLKFSGIKKGDIVGVSPVSYTHLTLPTSDLV